MRRDGRRQGRGRAAAWRAPLRCRAGALARVPAWASGLRRFVVVALACTLSPWSPTVLAQDGAAPALAARRDGAWTLVAADDLARALGADWSQDGRALTLRTELGVLTAFAGAADALWQGVGRATPDTVAAALPVQLVDGRWYLPEDLIGVLGVRLDGGELALPNGRRRPLDVAVEPASGGEAEEVVLGPGVTALRLYVADATGPDGLSLLAVDLGLLSLAFPEQTAALDAVLRDLRAEKALFLSVTAVADGAWTAEVGVEQDGREWWLAAPFGLQVLAGDLDRVGPDAPVAAIAFLPPDVDLRRPLTLRWSGVAGTWTSRR